MGLAPPPTRRQELADFLRQRRAVTSPEMVGLEANGRRRTPGLRREEVSQLAGVGLSWYTWLEQGREITPSPSVLDALARVYDLSPAERAHLFHLAGVALPTVDGDYRVEVPPELRAVVLELVPYPAYLTGPRTTPPLSQLLTRALGSPLDDLVNASNDPRFLTAIVPAANIVTTANELRDMMRRVVEEGTGTAANVGGLSVAGKTGTAETGVSGLNTAWFIAFAPADNPKIAIAVTIEHTPDFGGVVAAPIAASVIKAYLGSGVAK